MRKSIFNTLYTSQKFYEHKGNITRCGASQRIQGETTAVCVCFVAVTQ